MQHETPAISVLMAIHNGRQHLPEAIESILRQTYDDFEFIIVDDGSTDGSSEIIAEFSAKDARIRVITLRENVGLPAALNVGIESARGKYVARMDGDDISMPHRFEREVAHLQGDDTLFAVGSQVVLIDGEGRPLETVNTKKPTRRGEIRRQLEEFITVPIAHPTVLMRTAAVRRVGGYRTHFRYSQDLDLWLRAIESYEIENVDDVLLEYRLHPGSASVAKWSAQAGFHCKACLCAHLRAHGLDDSPCLAEPFSLTLVRQHAQSPRSAAILAATYAARVVASGHLIDVDAVRETYEAACSMGARQVMAPRERALVDLRLAKGYLHERRYAEATRFILRAVRADPTVVSLAARRVWPRWTRDVAGEHL